MSSHESDSAVIPAILMGQVIEVRPADDERLRDMYGGAIVLEVTVDGRRSALHLDGEGARDLAAAVDRCLTASENAYRLAMEAE
jgi:hypothetical protein